MLLFADAPTERDADLEIKNLTVRSTQSTRDTGAGPLPLSKTEEVRPC